MKEELDALKESFKKYGLMTITQYSRVHSVSRKTVYAWMRSGKLNNIKLGEVNFIISNDGDSKRTYCKLETKPKNKQNGDRNVSVHKESASRGLPILSEQTVVY